jgi:hypothetical protein
MDASICSTTTCSNSSICKSIWTKRKSNVVVQRYLFIMDRYLTRRHSSKMRMAVNARKAYRGLVSSRKRNTDVAFAEQEAMWVFSEYKKSMKEGTKCFS